MKKYKFKINGQTYEVEIGEFDGNNAKVAVNGTAYDVEIEGEDKKTKTPVLARKPVVNKPGEGDIKKSADTGKAYKVSSPLPGTIKKINVSVGATVKAGDCLMNYGSHENGKQHRFRKRRCSESESTSKKAIPSYKETL